MSFGLKLFFGASIFFVMHSHAAASSVSICCECTVKKPASKDLKNEKPSTVRIITTGETLLDAQAVCVESGVDLPELVRSKLICQMESYEVCKKDE